jgi:hypothetical protein
LISSSAVIQRRDNDIQGFVVVVGAWKFGTGYVIPLCGVVNANVVCMPSSREIIANRYFMMDLPSNIYVYNQWYLRDRKKDLMDTGEPRHPLLPDCTGNSLRNLVPRGSQTGVDDVHRL